MKKLKKKGRPKKEVPKIKEGMVVEINGIRFKVGTIDHAWIDKPVIELVRVGF
jgi:desulfoferrodoxin (superoxide reductase-like protein)